MVRKKYERTKPSLTIGTIGPVGHGKTTLTSAVTRVLAEQGATQFKSCDEIAFPYPPGARVYGGCFDVDVEYETDARHYRHVDRPGRECIKNLIIGTARLDGVILVISAKEGPTADTGEQLRVARQVGVRYVVVWINKSDLVDDPLRHDRVEQEIRELLRKYEYESDETPIIHGAATQALEGSEAEKDNICKLLKAVDAHIPGGTIK